MTRPPSQPREWVWSGAIALVAVLTAACPFYFALFFMRLYAGAGQPAAAIFSIGEGGLVACFGYLLAAVLYVAAPRLRFLLQLLAVALAVLTLLRLAPSLSFLRDKNMFTNLLAEPLWEGVGRLALAVLCVLHLVWHRVSARARAA